MSSFETVINTTALGKRKVFMPVDNSERTPHVVAWARKNVLREGDLVILFNAHKSASDELPGGGSKETVQKYNSEFHNASKSLLTTYANELNDFHVKGVLGAGKAKKLIDELLDIEQPDLIVMGKRDLGKVKQIFMGSVSNHVLNTRDIPVLIVP
ncbi:hypothetical protein HK103_006591 [Boothiomyces macroporosus]|uniref:UspA domain-containing protein n=1 Tax=Boothiomyces macroporosus TaxID=261099 RepID=A0AAD5U9I4_9FUNG|nr:hypothetical protein HK103_002593 [Boothiomyces macroporosus]KAJ3255128.1 hypothetical protein HK103_006591 [Boothiomyces macroporosus]